MKEDLNKWRDASCLWLGRFNVKVSFLPNLTYRFNWISIKVLVGFFGSNWQPDFNIQMKMQWTYSTKTSLKELNKAGEVTVPNFKTCYKATVTKRAQSWHKDGHREQRKEESSERDPQWWSRDSFTKVLRQLSEERVFSVNGAGATGCICQTNKLTLYRMPGQLTINHRSMCKSWNDKSSRENTGESLSHLGLGKDVSDGAQKAQVLKQKYNIWISSKLKNVCSLKNK